MAFRCGRWTSESEFGRARSSTPAPSNRLFALIVLLGSDARSEPGTLLQRQAQRCPYEVGRTPDVLRCLDLGGRRQPLNVRERAFQRVWLLSLAREVAH